MQKKLMMLDRDLAELYGVETKSRQKNHREKSALSLFENIY